MAVDAEIRTALADRLAALTLSPALPVAWDNLAFTPPAVGDWLEARLFRSGKTRLGNSRRHRHFGFLQVTVVAARDTGGAVPDRIAEKVAEHFPVDLKLAAGTRLVRITAEPTIASGYPDDPSWRVPVTINYELYD